METLILQMNPSNTQELILGQSGGLSNAIVDTTVNWAEKTQYIPKNGTIIVYSDAFEINNGYIPGIKIGDGITPVNDLPFATAYSGLPDKPQINGITLTGNKQLADLFSDGIIIDGGGA